MATERSLSFAEKNGLTQYRHVLHPRTLGFSYILQKMRKGCFPNLNCIIDFTEKCVEFVYDVTVAYADQIVQSEVDLVSSA